MQRIKQAASEVVIDQIQVEKLSIDSDSTLYSVDQDSLSVDVAEGVSAQIFMLHCSDRGCSMQFNLSKGATLRLVDIYTASVDKSVEVNLSKAANYSGVVIDLYGSQSRYDINLSGVEAFAQIDTLQLMSGDASSSLEIDMRHLSAECSSRSLSKCVASGSADIHFDGLVYVAKDAQRTNAAQNCRSIELSDSAHIVAQPQLEIYADDVKCSHGATVGQVDTDAILYMRQRGLSEAQARRVQIEGFVADIVDKCPESDLTPAIKELVEEQLQNM